MWDKFEPADNFYEKEISNFSKTELQQQIELERLKRENLKLQLELENKNNSWYDWVYRHDVFESNERSPTTIDIQVLGWKYYFDSDISRDYKKPLDKRKLSMSRNLRNGIQKWEIWEIKMVFWHRVEIITVEYFDNYLYFTNWHNSVNIFIKKGRKKFTIHIWDNVPKGKKWKYIEFQIKLDSI